MANGRTKREMLERLTDEGFCPPDTWTPAGIARVEVKRMRRSACMGCVAAEQPRRLGGGASSRQLAADTYLSKGIANTYYTLWRRMVTAKHAPLPAEELGDDEQDLYPPETWKLLHASALADEEARRAGLIVVWEDWWEELRPRLHSRQRAIATFATRTDRWAWGWRLVTSIDNELAWIENKFVNYDAKCEVPPQFMA